MLYLLYMYHVFCGKIYKQHGLDAYGNSFIWRNAFSGKRMENLVGVLLNLCIKPLVIIVCTMNAENDIVNFHYIKLYCQQLW